MVEFQIGASTSPSPSTISEHETFLTCLKCTKPIYKNEPEQEIKTENKTTSKTLKEVLSSFKQTTTLSDDSSPAESYQSKTQEIDSDSKINDDSIKIETNSITSVQNLKVLLSNTQISKSKLDEMNTNSKRINNNLKLYLIISILNDAKTGTSNQKADEESLLHLFRIKSVFFSSSKMDNTGLPVPIDNSLCICTNKSVYVFRIVNVTLFENNVEFEKCLSLEYKIEVNHIEIIELSIVQNYLIIEMLSDSTSDAESRVFIKLYTSDIYQTQILLNNLLSKY